ncbi:unnamed protein product, partial [Mesorhabditis spiculigera]
MKISLCRSYGVTVILKGNNIAKAKDYAMRFGKEKGLKYINGYDAPDILAGQGTIGLEILEQVPDVDAVLVPVGGGGLIAGVAVAIKTLKPECHIIGIETETCASFTAAIKEGRPIAVETSSTLADGLAVPTVGGNSLKTAAPMIDQIITVSEEVIALSILRLIEVERPGGIAELTTHIAHSGVDQDISTNEPGSSTDVFSVKVKIIAETRDRTHVQELEALLKEKYKNVTIL